MEEGFFNALSCREASRRVAAGFDEDAGFLVRALLSVHFLICRHCRRYRRQMRFLGSAARLWAKGMTATDEIADMEQRLINRLQARGREP